VSSIQSVNPANGELLKEFDPHSEAEWRKIVEAAAGAQYGWGRRALSERTELLAGLGDHLRANAADYGRLIALEMGKPIGQAVAEVEKSALCCDYYAVEAAGLLGEDVVSTDASRSAVQYLPLGVVLAVMPWNYPFWQVIRAAIPAIAAGNTVLLKHASNVPQSALALEGAFAAADFPAGVLSTILVPGRETAAVIRHPAVAGVTLTGSEPAGRDVGRVAGEELKKAVLELGGSDPFIVLADADVAAAGVAASQSRTLNNGQSCIAAKRFLVDETVYDEFLDAFRVAMDALVVGDQLDPSTQLGPLARVDLRDELHDQVNRTVAEGGQLVAGGRRPDGPGAFYPATIVTAINPGMTAFDEELFGPVAAVTAARGDEELIHLANTSRFGLGASVWTRDTERAERLAPQVESGMVFVNGIVKSDPRLPFGGVKASGHGRELGAQGIREFVNTRTLWVGAGS
jgi:succinate-semialdehyde dehydrogenase/glutarate-semialdehyde dehydrogenase